MSKTTDLSKYDNSNFSVGASKAKQLIWYFVNSIFFISSLCPFIGIKLFLLKFFGAKIGKGVIIKPSVNIKYPWKLIIGDSSWIGERVWIDNLVTVEIGNNVCISQGALIITGNHDYKKSTFDLHVKSIIIENGVWIGTKAIVSPGVICKSHSVLSSGSIATKNLESYGIYQGNPATLKRKRIIQ